MFRTVLLSIIRSLFTVHSAMIYVIQLSSSTRMESQFFPGPAGKLSINLYDIYHIYIHIYCLQAGPRWKSVPSWSCWKAVYKRVLHIPYIYIYIAFIQVCRQLSSRTRKELRFHPGPARKLYDLYHC